MIQQAVELLYEKAPVSAHILEKFPEQEEIKKHVLHIYTCRKVSELYYVKYLCQYSDKPWTAWDKAAEEYLNSL